MARRKVVVIDAEKTIEWDKPGRKVSGHYVGFKEVESTFGLSKLHVLSTETGTVGVWGAAQLDEQLKEVARGAMCWITFLGKKPIKNKKTKKFFETEWDDELVDEALASAAIVQREASEEEQEEESGSEGEPEQEESEEAPSEDETPDADEESMETSGDEEEEEAAPLKPAAKAPPKKGPTASPAQLAASKGKTEALLSKTKR